LLAVSLLRFADPGPAARLAESELAAGGYGGCDYLVANRASAHVILAPGARQVTVKSLAPGLHAMTNLDVDDLDDPRIRFVHQELKPGRFLESATRICRDDRIVVVNPERGTVSSSLILVGRTIRFYHALGDPRANDYEQMQAF
jgi:hypothetical protein